MAMKWGKSTRERSGGRSACRASGICVQSLVQDLDPVPHRRARTRCEMRKTADIGRGNLRGTPRFECVQLVGLEQIRKLGLQHGIGAGRSATKMRVGDRREVESERR